MSIFTVIGKAIGSVAKSAVKVVGKALGLSGSGGQTTGGGTTTAGGTPLNFGDEIKRILNAAASTVENVGVAAKKTAEGAPEAAGGLAALKKWLPFIAVGLGLILLVTVFMRKRG